MSNGTNKKDDDSEQKKKLEDARKALEDEQTKKDSEKKKPDIVKIPPAPERLLRNSNADFMAFDEEMGMCLRNADGKMEVGVNRAKWVSMAAPKAAKGSKDQPMVYMAGVDNLGGQFNSVLAALGRGNLPMQGAMVFVYRHPQKSSYLLYLGDGIYVYVDQGKDRHVVVGLNDNELKKHRGANEILAAHSKGSIDGFLDTTMDGNIVPKHMLDSIQKHANDKMYHMRLQAGLELEPGQTRFAPKHGIPMHRQEMHAVLDSRANQKFSRISHDVPRQAVDARQYQHRRG